MTNPFNDCPALVPELKPIIAKEDLPELQLPDITSDTSEADGQTADARFITFQLAAMAAGIKSATSVDELCKLALTSASLLEKRRHLLCRPYGYKDTSKNGAFTLSVD